MTRQRLLVIGWREWITLSGLACPIPIKAKIDTGAATSALHASKLERFEVDGQPWVRFTVRPHQRRAGGRGDAGRGTGDRRATGAVVERQERASTHDRD